MRCTIFHFPVFHEDGSRTVLTALPATFGMPIINETKVRIILREESKLVSPNKGENETKVRIILESKLVSPLSIHQVSGRLILLPSNLCSAQPSNQLKNYK